VRTLKGLSYGDIAFEVCSAFERAGTVAVLVGGGAAALYAPGAYQTRDLDFVLPWELFGGPKLSVIGELGFTHSTARGTYEHPEIPYTLEILPGPLAVGDQTLASYETLTQGELKLHIVSPTDCVKDRLAAAIHWHDLNSIRQAAAVARVQPIEMESVRRWCEAEGDEDAFRRLQAFLEK
jgi:hypothetical protein